MRRNSVACVIEFYHNFAAYRCCPHRFEASDGYWDLWMGIDFRASAGFLGERGASWRPLPLRSNPTLLLLEKWCLKATRHAARLTAENPVPTHSSLPSLSMNESRLSEWRGSEDLKPRSQNRLSEKSRTAMAVAPWSWPVMLIVPRDGFGLPSPVALQKHFHTEKEDWFARLWNDPGDVEATSPGTDGTTHLDKHPTWYDSVWVS